MGICYIQIAMALTNPLIVWVALLNVLIFGGTIVILTTYASLLVHPPYAFSLQRASFSNLATVIGALLAWPAAGIMTTRLCHRLVMRNGGVRDAEHYLPAFILPILSAPVSLIIYGFAGEQGWHWFWIFFSMGLNSFACVTLFTVTTLVSKLLWVSLWKQPGLIRTLLVGHRSLSPLGSSRNGYCRQWKLRCQFRFKFCHGATARVARLRQNNVSHWHPDLWRWIVCFPSGDVGSEIQILRLWEVGIA
jgi:hypothetical protein